MPLQPSDNTDSERDRWDDRYREVEGLNNVNELIGSLITETQPAGAGRSRGRALDIAGGSGADALFLAGNGFDSTLLDVSPVGLQLAEDAATERGLAISTVAVNTERAPLPEGPWDLIHIAHYLHRPTIAAAAAALAPGGILVVSIATTTNLERHERPPAMFLLKPGELGDLAPDLEVVRYDEDWRANGVHEAWLVAKAVTA